MIICAVGAREIQEIRMLEDVGGWIDSLIEGGLAREQVDGDRNRQCKFVE